MTAPLDSPSVLNTTVPSNYAFIDRIELLEVLPRVCAVPSVRQELSDGKGDHPYLQTAYQAMGDTIPVVDIDAECADLTTTFETRLDPGEAEALAVAVQYDGILVTDDGPARSFAAEHGVHVTGSIGILLRSIEQDCIDISTADTWLKEWIDEADYRAPSRDISDYIEA
jgi:predicted nucleic acid-binding protein